MQVPCIHASFLVTVQAATLIHEFISVRGSAILSALEGNSGSIYNLVNKLFELANVCAFHENRDHIYTELTFINP